LLAKLCACLVVAAAGFTVAVPAYGAFPGANGSIAFTRGAHIWKMNPDGSGATQITFGTGEPAPDWSADGHKIAFYAYPDGFHADVFTINADGSGQTQLTSNSVDDQDPSWSADGTKIAFSSKRDGARQVYVMNADGTNVTKLTNNPINAGAPVWSPDGTRIAFTESNPTGDVGQVKTMDPAGGNVSAPLFSCASPPSACFATDWSPDSLALTVTSVGGSSGDVYRVNANGSGFTNLTPGPGQTLDRDGTWSPDGSKIAFIDTSSGGGAVDVWLMNSDGSNPAPIATTPEQEGGPDWQSLSTAPYPRPGGASPLRLTFEPAFERCATPNSAHVAPLDYGSCTPPASVSGLLTTSDVGRGQAVGRFDVMCTAGGSPPCLTPTGNKEDVGITLSASDVECVSGGTPGCALAGGDYAGKVALSTVIRITDRTNGFEGQAAGTVEDTHFDIPVDCTPTTDVAIGSTCSLTTTANTVLPGVIGQRKRTVISTPSIAIVDAGPDGSITPSSGACPPTCGSGDETTYLEQGLFAP
jgi:Tol biopolymer transport system component